MKTAPGWRKLISGAARGLVCAVLLAGCALPGNAAPIVKIALIAPFEGLGRPLGYALLPAVRIALGEANASGALGRYRVALVALNDDNDPSGAAAQARSLVVDPDVLVAIGPWSARAAGAAAEVLGDAGLPVLPGALLVQPGGLTLLCPPGPQVAEQMLAQSAVFGEREPRRAGTASPLASALAEAGGSGLSHIGSTAEAPAGTLVLHTGDAAEAAADLLRWRVAGWQGRLLGGPEVARPWLVGLAGPASEGVRAVVCAPETAVPASFVAAYRAQTGAEPGHEASLAYAATAHVLQAIAADVSAHGAPTRAGVGDALRAGPFAAAPLTVEVRDGVWQVIE